MNTKSVSPYFLCALCLLFIIFYIIFEPFLSPYILSELTSNLLLRKVGPRYLMATFVIVWGVVVTLQGGSQPNTPTSE